MGDSSTNNPIKRLARITAGGVLVVVGLVGLVMPVMPGWLFIIPGLTLWSSEFRWAARLRQRTVTFVRRHRGGQEPDEVTVRNRPAA
ncbi:hypothetical protein BH23ACT5_BH23ACT5_24490 [soil metagenome]